jgi:hypothetical protein
LPQIAASELAATGKDLLAALDMPPGSTSLRIAFSRSHKQGFAPRSRSLARAQQVFAP